MACLELLVKINPKLYFFMGFVIMVALITYSTRTDSDTTFAKASIGNILLQVSQKTHDEALGEDQPVTHCTQEVQQLIFLKVHKAASSTVQNILFRFGLKRNLTFVIPERTHYISKQKWHINKLLPPPVVIKKKETHEIRTKEYDILCNHAIFNRDKFRELMPSATVYIAIVRDPLALFLSAAFYYRYVWPAEYLEAINKTSFIHDLIHYPEKFEETPIVLSRTYNTMSHDFGFEVQSVQEANAVSNESIDEYLMEVGGVFNVVMVSEYFAESLVLLKRSLGWDLGDILYIKNNETPDSIKKELNRISLSPNDRLTFQQRNRLDYKLYDFFRGRFLKEILQEPMFDEEVAVFKKLTKSVEIFCKIGMEKQNILHIDNTEWHKSIDVTKEDCELMKMSELNFFGLLRKRHLNMLKASSYLGNFRFFIGGHRCIPRC